MGCNCGNKNKRLKMQQQVNRAKQANNLPNGLTAKQYLDHLKQKEKK